MRVNYAVGDYKGLFYAFDFVKEEGRGKIDPPDRKSFKIITKNSKKVQKNLITMEIPAFFKENPPKLKTSLLKWSTSPFYVLLKGIFALKIIFRDNF